VRECLQGVLSGRVARVSGQSSRVRARASLGAHAHPSSIPALHEPDGAALAEARGSTSLGHTPPSPPFSSTPPAAAAAAVMAVAATTAATTAAAVVAAAAAAAETRGEWRAVGAEGGVGRGGDNGAEGCMQDGDAGADVRERMGGVEGGGVCRDGDREIGGAEGVERAAGGLHDMLGVLQNRLLRLQERVLRLQGRDRGIFFLFFNVF
jgi:hypothetical protein